MLEVENWWNGRSHRAAEVGLSGKSRSADVDPNRAENLMRSGFLGLPAFSLSSMFNINELSVFWNFRFWSQNLEVKGCCEYFHKVCYGSSGGPVEASHCGALGLTAATQFAGMQCWREKGTLIKALWALGTGRTAFKF